MAVKKGKARGNASKTKRARGTLGKMDELAKKLGKWDPQSIVRKLRDSNLSGKS